MRSILYNKRAELTTQQIVMIIILVVSFAVILFFIFRLNFQSESIRDVCHNSVALRGNAALPGSTTTIPLNCRQSYVCVTADGTCDTYNAASNQWQKMSSYDYRIVVKNEKELHSALAEEMASCWWMFGEGKVNYVGDELFENNYCSICSQLRFDNSIKDKLFPNGIIDKDDFYRKYLATEKMPGRDITYAQYLYGSNDVNKLLSGADEKSNQQVSGSFGSIDLNSNTDYIVIMGITNEISTIKWVALGIATGVGLAVVTIATGGLGLVAGAILVAGAGTAGGIGTYTFLAATVKGQSGNNYISPTIIPFPSNEFDSLSCEEIKTLA